jgi:hypothetical protein
MKTTTNNKKTYHKKGLVKALSSNPCTEEKEKKWCD